MLRVQDPIIPIVGRWTRETPGTISLGQGLVSYGPPREALEAIRQFGHGPADHLYGPVEGEPDLVAALEEKLARENGITVRPDSRVVVTAGGNMAFFNAVLAVGDPGDEFILPVPFYFNHEMAIEMAGCRAVPVPTTADYQLDLAAIERAITPRTRAIVTISPNNPSGAVYPEADLRALSALCAVRGLYHINDEVYEYFTYDEATHFSPGSIAGAAAHTISLFSLSKAYGFASWRIGYMVIPAALFDAVNKIQDTNLICPPLVSQRAALAAVRVGRAHTAPHVAALADARHDVLRQLGGLGDLASVPAVAGAFYVLVRVHTDVPMMALVERLIRDHKVAVIPGSAFGLDAAVVRLSYGALERASVEQGVGRLVAGLRALCGRDGARTG
jgi:aspartate/methionine/tyrosine aminotransferase